MIIMQKKEKRIKHQRGSITVEALLFLIVFLCAFWTLLNVAGLVRAQYIIQHAIVQSTKEVSGYAYIITKAYQEPTMQSTYGKNTSSTASNDEISSSLTDMSEGDGDGSFQELVGSISDELDLSSIAVGMIVSAKVEAYLDEITGDADEYLENVGIIGGMSGLDFGETEFNVGENSTLKVVVTYSMTNQLFPYIDLGEWEFSHTAYTGVW